MGDSEAGYRLGSEDEYRRFNVTVNMKTTVPIHVVSVDICMTTVKRVHRFVPKIGIICRASVENLTSVASKRVGHM